MQLLKDHNAKENTVAEWVYFETVMKKYQCSL